MDNIIDKIIKQRFGYITLAALEDVMSLEGCTLNGDELLTDMDENRVLYFEVNDGFAHVLGAVTKYGDEITVGLLGKGVEADTENNIDYVYRLI